MEAMKRSSKAPCTWHKPHGLGYLSWFQWADKLTSKGHEQRQCEDCKHWFFPSQFGAKPDLLAVAKALRRPGAHGMLCYDRGGGHGYECHGDCPVKEKAATEAKES